MDAIALRPVEAAKLIGMSRSSFYTLLRGGEIRFYKVGSCTYIPADELRRFVAERSAR